MVMTTIIEYLILIGNSFVKFRALWACGPQGLAVEEYATRTKNPTIKW